MRRIAVFDFDKTLSTRDNVVPFLRLVVGDGPTARALLALTPQLVAAAVRDERRDAVKRGLARRLLAGRESTDLCTLGERFADDVVAAHLRAELVERAEWHRSRGHELVIVSASFAAYLEPIARRLRFDAALGTELAVDADGRLTGELAGPNVRRGEKVRRLDAWLGGTPAEIWAYGDGTGDRELLARADHPVRA